MSVTNSNAISFSSTMLEDAFNEVEFKFNGLTEALDGVSNDIRQLENVLNKKGVTIPFVKHFSGSFSSEPSIDEHEGGVCLSGPFTSNVLVWKENDKGYFRLFYRKISYEYAVCDANSIFMFSQVDGTIDFEKPLIECKSDIRLGMAECLPDFIKSLGDKLPGCVFFA